MRLKGGKGPIGVMVGAQFERQNLVTQIPKDALLTVRPQRKQQDQPQGKIKTAGTQ